MAIIVPIHSFEPGGVERVALHLAAAWQADGAEVRTVLGRRDGAMDHLAPGLDYVIRPSLVPTAGWETLWMILCLWRYLRRNPGGVIFASGNTYAVVGVAMKLLLGRHCPPVLLKISNDLERRDLPLPARLGYYLWLRIQGAMLDRFVAMAPALAPEIALRMRVPAERVTVIEDPSLAPGQFAALSAIPRSAGPATGNLLAVGRLAGQKNYPLMLRALAAASGFTGTLTICGDGAERARLEALTDELGLSGRVVFAGHCRDVTPYLAQASARVLSSDYEGLPAVAIEALAAGLPLIATDSSAWLHELLGDGKLGILVPRGDILQLSLAFSALSALAFDPAAARTYAREFTIERAAPPYRTALGSIAACAKSPAL